MNKRSKKLIAIVKYFYPVAAGIETNMLETYSVLAKKGWDITIFTTKDTLTGKNLLKDFEMIRNLKVKRLSYMRYALLQFEWNRANLVCLHNFDLIPQMFILVSSLIRKTLGKKDYKLFITPHGGFTPEWTIFNPASVVIKRTIHYTLGTFLINKVVDGVRAVSLWEKKEIVARGVNANKVSVISNGVEDEAYLDVKKIASQVIKEKVRAYGKYLIQIGRIYPIKNYETPIRTLAQVPNDINFVIAGPVSDNAYFEKLKTIIKELRVEKRVFFAGVIRGVDKYYLIKNAQIMVHMAIWESFCNVVHEGMSQGLPCIVANNTALPLLIKNGKNGFCVGTKDHSALAEKINFILKNKNTPKVKEISQTNRKFGLQESWQNVAEKMGNLYQSVI